MKKTLIAGAGVAALGVAVLPLAGVFAAVEDTVRITISSSCTVVGNNTQGSTEGKLFEANMTVNDEKIWDATSSEGGNITVSCNSGTGWNITAIGSSSTTNNSSITSMTPALATSTPIPTGTSGNAYWAMKVAGAGVGETSPNVNTFASWHAVPATQTKVAASNQPISEGTLYTGYKVHTSATQEADTYTGKVTYTIATGLGS